MVKKKFAFTNKLSHFFAEYVSSKVMGVSKKMTYFLWISTCSSQIKFLRATMEELSEARWSSVSKLSLGKKEIQDPKYLK